MGGGTISEFPPPLSVTVRLPSNLSSTSEYRRWHYANRYRCDCFLKYLLNLLKMPFSRSVANEIGISWYNQYQRRIGKFYDFFCAKYREKDDRLPDTQAHMKGTV